MCQVVESMCFNQMISAYSWALTVKVKRFRRLSTDVSILVIGSIETELSLPYALLVSDTRASQEIAE